jgi:SAM-dependent methyltransferase
MKGDDAMDSATLKAQVRARYGALAQRAGQGDTGGCGCGCGPGCDDPISSDLYSADETAALPGTAVQASLGCGNPTALAQLEPGETVLDLGSGGGLDVLLSARRVAPTGKAYGLDMTEEMLELARANQRAAGVTNAEFLKGDIENIPLPDASVDVIISNCVVNLAADKHRVLSEAFRVLRPGGRLAISDIVVLGEPPAEVRRSVELWLGCVAGALEVETFHRLLAEAGFVEDEIEITRVYRQEDARQIIGEQNPESERLAREADGLFASGFVRARKP